MPAGPTAKMAVLPPPACATGVDRLYAKGGSLTPAGGPRGRVSLRWRGVPEAHRPTLD